MSMGFVLMPSPGLMLTNRLNGAAGESSLPPYQDVLPLRSKYADGCCSQSGMAHFTLAFAGEYYNLSWLGLPPVSGHAVGCYSLAKPGLLSVTVLM